MAEDTVTTRYILQISEYIAGSKQIVEATNATHHAIAQAQSATQSMGGSLRSVGVGFLGVGAALLATATAAVGTAVGFMKVAAAEGKMEAGIRSLAGSTEGANAQLERLHRLAYSPGLDFETLLRGVTRMEAVGMSAQEAETSMRALGNATASMGTGLEATLPAAEALSRLMTRPYASLREIRQLMSEIPNIQAVIRQGFGTADPEELKKMGVSGEMLARGIVSQLNTWKTAQGGMANDFKNLGLAWHDFEVQVGNAFGSVLGPVLKSVSEHVSKLANDGTLERVAKGIAGAFGGKDIGDALNKAIDKVAGYLEEFPKHLEEIVRWSKILFGVWAGVKLWGIADAWWNIGKAIGGVGVALKGVAVGVGMTGGATALSGAAAAAGTAANPGFMGGMGTAAYGAAAYSVAGAATVASVAAMAAAVLGTAVVGYAIGTLIDQGLDRWAQANGAENAGDWVEKNWLGGNETAADAAKPSPLSAAMIARGNAKKNVGRTWQDAQNKRMADISAGDAWKASLGVSSGQTSPVQSTLMDIAQSSRTIARNTDHARRSVFGGGDLARMGVSPVEMHGVTGRSRIAKALAGLHSAISHEISEQVGLELIGIRRLGL